MGAAAGLTRGGALHPVSAAEGLGLSSIEPGLQRIGLFGSAFDPPHNAHVALVRMAVTQLGLHRVLVLPTGFAWHKARRLLAAEHRVAMARLAFADNPLVSVDVREVQRDGPTYTIDTVRELRREMPQAHFFLLLGQDQAEGFTSWHEWQPLMLETTVCMAARSLDPTADFPGQPRSAAAGDAVPQALKSHAFLTLNMPPLALSATDVRQRVARGEGIAQLVPPAVASYIADHHLYQPS